MNKEDWRKLLPLVNDYQDMEILIHYANKRIEQLHKDLESPGCTLDQVRLIQGAIRELRRLMTLREEAISGAK